jgi:hypothetical protein
MASVLDLDAARTAVVGHNGDVQTHVRRIRFATAGEVVMKRLNGLVYRRCRPATQARPRLGAAVRDMLRDSRRLPELAASGALGLSGASAADGEANSRDHEIGEMSCHTLATLPRRKGSTPTLLEGQDGLDDVVLAVLFSIEVGQGALRDDLRGPMEAFREGRVRVDRIEEVRVGQRVLDHQRNFANHAVNAIPYRPNAKDAVVAGWAYNKLDKP